MKMSVVIPVYGCRKAIPELYRRLTESVSQITDDYELIMVNDKCPQNSWESIEELCVQDTKVKGIELSRNFGQMKAILAGLDYASGDWIVVMDCDLQDRPEEIPRLYQKALEGYDVVFARRKKRKDGWLKVFWANIFYKIYQFATDGNYDGAVCNFSIVRRDVINSYCRMREYHRGYVMYIKWLGYRQTAIDVQHDKRYEGHSSYNLKKKINMALELLTSQSDKIMKLFAGLGSFMSLTAAFIILVLIIYKCIANVSVGWTSTIATIILIGGIIISIMGILGIYIGNIFMQTKERPLYIVRQILDLGNNTIENEEDKK